MAKRTRSSRRRDRDAASPADAAPSVEASTAPTVETPRPPARARGLANLGLPAWFDVELSWATWVAFRVVFFSLHAVDAVLQLRHAPRYGAGGFNVSQLPFDLIPAPTRTVLCFVYGALAIVFALCACGVAMRALVPLAAALYGYAYFASQLDSYQHHYLMFLVLVLLALVPSAPTRVDGVGRARLRSWALRLVLIQLGVLYLWAAIAKLDPAWLDGTLLKLQAGVGPDGAVRSGSRLFAWAVGAFGVAALAIGVLAVEFTLAATVWVRRLWFVALPLGVGLHVGIELIDLDIGLFSYFMIGTYLLLVPDRVTDAAAAALARATAPLARIPTTVLIAVGGVGAALGLIVIARHPLPLLGVAAVGAALFAGLVVAARSAGPRAIGRRLLACALAAAVTPTVLATTDVAADHFRTWAGASRRLGLPSERAAYEGLLAVDPSSEYAHFYLGRLEHVAGRYDAAVAHFVAAQKSAPTRERSYLAEADSHLARGDRAAARAALERGLIAMPGHPSLTARLTAIGAP